MDLLGNSETLSVKSASYKEHVDDDDENLGAGMGNICTVYM